MRSELGQFSSGLMPFAAAPWVLIRLVRGSRAGSTRRAAVRSGGAFLFASGVNAAATVAIPLAVLGRYAAPRRTISGLVAIATLSAVTLGALATIRTVRSAHIST
jgi:arabinofuranan 3-O-arabinosyltransferase